MDNVAEHDLNSHQFMLADQARFSTEPIELNAGVTFAQLAVSWATVVANYEGWPEVVTIRIEGSEARDIILDTGLKNQTLAHIQKIFRKQVSSSFRPDDDLLVDDGVHSITLSAGRVPSKSNPFFEGLRLNVSKRRTSVSYLSAYFSQAQAEIIHKQTDLISANFIPMSNQPLFNVATMSIAEAAERQLSIGEKFTCVKEDVIDLILDQERARPDSIALEDNGEIVTYGSMLARAREVADELKRHGVKSGVGVAVCLGRSADFVIGVIGILLAEGTYIPVDPELPSARRLQILEKSRARIVIDHVGPDGCEDRAFEIHESQFALADQTEIGDSPIPSNAAYILFTSGSTGVPKGVIISRQSLAYYTQVAIQSFSLATADRVLQFASTSFDTHVEEVFPALCSGATLVIRHRGVSLNPTEFFKFLRSSNITLLDLPTGYWRELAKYANYNRVDIPLNVRIVIIAGEALFGSDAMTWCSENYYRPPLVNTYGPTEATIVATQHFVQLKDYTHGETILVGMPIPGTDIAILDRRGYVVPEGACGEICISGPGVGIGYLNDTSLTEEKFISGEFDGKLRRLYRTGDIGRVNSRGMIEYLGRYDDVVKHSGYRISLKEVESTLRCLPEVADCGVLTVRHEERSRLIAVILSSLPKDVVPSIKSQLRSLLPAYMIPNQFIMVDEIPRNNAGKIDYNAIRGLINSFSFERQVDVEGAVDNEIHKGIEQILGLTVDWKSGFLENGGDSLAAIRLCLWCEEQHGISLSLERLYDAETLDAFVSGLLEAQGEMHFAETQPASTSFEAWRMKAVNDGLEQLPSFSGHQSRVAGSVLLTGATGFLGRHLIVQLAAQTDQQIYCVVRPGSTTESRLRLADAVRSVVVEWEKILDRITILEGDIRKKYFGFSDEILSTLKNTVSDIICCAADTNMLASYSSLAPTNVSGTINAIEVGEICHAHVHYISSMVVLDAYPPLPCTTAEVDIFQIGHLAGGYAQTKWVSEAIIAEVAPNSSGVSVYRCGRIWSAKSSPVRPTSDFLYQFLRTCGRVMAVPDIPMHLEISPADQCARRIVSGIVRRWEDKSERFALVDHVHSSILVTRADLIEAFRGKIEVLDPDEWKRRVKQLIVKFPEDRDLSRVLTVVLAKPCDQWVDNLLISTEEPANARSATSQNGYDADEISAIIHSGSDFVA